MKIIYLTALVACCVIGCSKNPKPSSVVEKSPSEITPKEIGVQKAKQDIADGEMKILYYGKPWSQGKPLVDDLSGLPIEIVAGCCVTSDFIEETNAYNETMRNKVTKIANQEFEPTRKPPSGSAE